MRFTEAWASTASQNVSLKVALGVVTILVLFLGFSTVRLALKKPLLIERACHSKAIAVTSSAQSSHEIEAFAKLALQQRLESKSTILDGYLSQSEVRKKAKEQILLTKRGIQQFISNIEIKLKDKVVIASLDRIFAYKKIRSAVPSLYSLTLETKPRSASNPYGLILVDIKENERGSNAKN